MLVTEARRAFVCGRKGRADEEHADIGRGDLGDRRGVVRSRCHGLTAASTDVSGLNARVRALEANVRSLKSQMASTKKKVNQLVGALACLTAQGLSSYGDGTTSGYFYTNDAGATVFLTHATDFDPGLTPTAWMARVNPACVSSSKSMQNFRYQRSPSITPKTTR